MRLILSTYPNGLMQAQVVPVYKTSTGKDFNPETYGKKKLTQVLEAIPDVVKVKHNNVHYYIHTALKYCSFVNTVLYMYITLYMYMCVCILKVNTCLTDLYVYCIYLKCTCKQCSFKIRLICTTFLSILQLGEGPNKKVYLNVVPTVVPVPPNPSVAPPLSLEGVKKARDMFLNEVTSLLLDAKGHRLTLMQLTEKYYKSFKTQINFHQLGYTSLYEAVNNLSNVKVSHRNN